MQKFLSSQNTKLPAEEMISDFSQKYKTMTLLEALDAKIVAAENLHTKIALWKFKGYKVVFTNGCFDILHRGHIEYLAQAAEFGDILVVGMNTDESVRRLKGEGRPLQDQVSRSTVLSAIEFVSNVVLFDEDTPYELIKLIQPDVLVKGADYKAEDIVGYDIVKAKGGEVVTVPIVEGHSTSNVIAKMKC
jgi:rfaE bifunctional protein nucleotidyltransferase chain/domain